MLGKLFLIFAGYVLIRIIIYYFKARKVFKDVMNQAQHQARPHKKEGEITITRDPKKLKKDKDNRGDFVDYEEVD
jgi:flagellar biosynthesis/type III secretory pathway M-ring protein FliF/YscJ